MTADEKVELVRFITAFRESAYKQAERNELSWSAQRASIRAGMIDEPLSRVPAFAFAAVLAAVILAGGLMLRPVQQQAPPQTSPIVLSESDDALLRSVNESSDVHLPDALAPAGLLAEEIDRGLRQTQKKQN